MALSTAINTVQYINSQNWVYLLIAVLAGVAAIGCTPLILIMPAQARFHRAKIKQWKEELKQINENEAAQKTE